MGKVGQITSDMVVWRDGMDKWQPASKVKGLAVKQLPPVPPPAPQQPAITVAFVPAPASQPMPVSGHVTIEKTGKSLKLHQLLSFLFIVIGFGIATIAIKKLGVAIMIEVIPLKMYTVEALLDHPMIVPIGIEIMKAKKTDKVM